MMSIRLLLSLTLFGTLQSIRVTFRNNCDYKVQFTKKGFVGTNIFNAQITEVPYYVDAKLSQEIENNKTHLADFYSIRASCSNMETNCDVGEPPSTCLCDGCCTNKLVETMLFLSVRYSRFYTHSYDIINSRGYNIPVQVSPTGTGADKCRIIKCNVTLDECPDNENYGIGDLRVMKGNRTVACVSPCTKLSYPPPHGQGLHRDQCTKEKYPNLKYMDLMDRKCPGYVSHFLKAPFDEIIVNTKCPGTNKGYPILEFVTCP